LRSNSVHPASLVNNFPRYQMFLDVLKISVNFWIMVGPRPATTAILVNMLDMHIKKGFGDELCVQS